MTEAICIRNYKFQLQVSDIQGGPEKNETAYFPQYVDAITVSVYEK